MDQHLRIIEYLLCNILMMLWVMFGISIKSTRISVMIPIVLMAIFWAVMSISYRHF